MLTSVPRFDADFCRGTLKRRKPITIRRRNCRKAARISSYGHQRLRVVETLQSLMLACEHRPFLSDRRTPHLTLKQRSNAGEVLLLTTKNMQSAKPHGKRIEASYLQKPMLQGLATTAEKRRRRRLSIHISPLQCPISIRAYKPSYLIFVLIFA